MNYFIVFVTFFLLCFNAALRNGKAIAYGMRLSVTCKTQFIGFDEIALQFQQFPLSKLFSNPYFSLICIRLWNAMHINIFINTSQLYSFLQTLWKHGYASSALEAVSLFYILDHNSLIIWKILMATLQEVDLCGDYYGHPQNFDICS